METAYLLEAVVVKFVGNIVAGFYRLFYIVFFLYYVSRVFDRTI